MIPYFYPDPITIIPGTIVFHVFGLLVGLAVVTGAFIAQRKAEQWDLNPRVMADGAIWFVVVGFIVAHIFAVIFYYPDRIVGMACSTQADCVDATYQGIFGAPSEFVCKSNGRCNNGSWSSLLMIWNGISSVGGFLGAALGILWWGKVERLRVIPGFFELEGAKGRPVVKYLDAAAYGMAFAWIFGRMACAAAHDHPGVLTKSFMAIKFPKTDWPQWVTPEALEMFPTESYIMRYDLGFMEMLFAIVISAVFFVVSRMNLKLRPGWYAANLVFWYAPYRLYLDSLRATDIAHADPRNALGLTPAQVSVLVMLGVGILLWWWGGRLKKDPAYMDDSKFPVELEERKAAAQSA